MTGTGIPSKNLLDSMIRNNSAVMLVFDPSDGAIVYANRAAVEFYGYPAETLLHMNIHDINQLAPEELRLELDQVLLEQRSRFIFPHKRANGDVRTVEVHSSKIMLESREYLLSIVHDITGQIEAEELLRKYALQYEILANTTTDGFLVMDLAGNIVSANEKCSALYGYTREELVERNIVDFEVMQAEIANRPGKSIDTRYDRFETIHRRKDGMDIDVEVSVSLLPQIGLQMAFIRDISDRNRLTETLRSSLQELRVLYEQFPAGIGWLDEEGNVEYLNKAFTDQFGYTLEDIPTLEDWFRLAFPDPEYLNEVCSWYAEQVIAKKNNASIPPREMKISCKDGSFRDVLILSSHIFNRIVGVYIDLTDRKRADAERKRLENERMDLERQLLHAQKLESMGVLAGGIAHDFNNILSVIVGNAEMGLMRIDEKIPAADNLRRILKAAERAADLARQMLAYSGKGKFLIAPLNLNRLLEEMLNLLDVSISKKADLQFDLAGELPTIEADATQIRQVVMNLVINASEAIDDESGGVITVRTGCGHYEPAGRQHAFLAENSADRQYVFLEIADSGCGMDRETVEKIFDPFFTTKFTGRGLGMAAVLGILRGHKGAIQIASEPGMGSAFRILLPVPDTVAEAANGPPGSGVWHGKGTVLFVDDEDAVLGIGCEMVASMGMTTIPARDGREALELFKANPGIDLVIIDLTMPEMDGVQCCQELRKQRQDVKIIFSSGFSEHEVSRKIAGTGVAGFIQKPYSFPALREALTRAISG